MSFGLRVWDASSRVTLDNVDNVGRLFASISFPGWSGTQVMTVSVPGLDPDRTAYVLNSPTHTHLAIQLLPGRVEAWLTRADSLVGNSQPAFSMQLIFTR